MKTIKSRKTHISILSLVVCFVLLVVAVSCSKDDGVEEVKSSAKQITSFVFLLTNNPITVNVIATIDEQNKSITATMPPSTSLSGLLPEVKISDLASVDVTTAQDFTNPIEYTITAEDGSKAVYTVTITALLTQRQILQTILDVNPDNTLNWNLQSTTNLGDLDGIRVNTEDKIVELHMRNKNLVEIPPEIGQLVNLKSLVVWTNQLTSIPPEIGQLVNLRDFFLNSNQLTSLPPEIGELIDLVHFEIAGNQLNSLPPEIGQLSSLERISLGKNELTTVPPEMGQLINLEYLDLEFNPITSIPQEVCDLQKSNGGNLFIRTDPGEGCD